MPQSSLPRNVRFEDACRLAEGFGFHLDRTSGSHRIFRHPLGLMVNLQPDRNGQAKLYAYGKPTKDSDVDLLVIMPRTRDRGERISVRILHTIPRDFPLDLLVRTPADIAKRLHWKDPFICEVIEKGKVLYEAHHARMGQVLCSWR